MWESRQKKKYKVVSTSLGGRGNKIYHKDDVVTNMDFLPGRAEQLVKKGFLIPDPDNKPIDLNKFTENMFDHSKFKTDNIKNLKVVITTMIWKRHKIFELWALGILRLKKEFNNIEIDVVVAGSERDKSKKLVEKFGFHYIEFPNSPLGSKANARLLESKKFNPDYVVLIGSDDIISNECFALMLNLMQEGYDEIAPLDIYYHDILTNTSAYSHGYQGKRIGEPVAVGRTLSKKLLDRVGWKLWSESENAFLDGWSRNKVNKHKKNHKYFSCRENGVIICDVKSDLNMTKFKMRSNYEEIDSKIILNQIPELACVVY